MKKIMSFLLTVLLFVSLLASIIPAYADGVDITEEFTDGEFRAAALAALGKDEEGRIFEEEAAGIKKLNLYSVSNLAGIGYLSGLEQLNVSSDYIETVELGGLTSLEKLAFRDCVNLSSVRLFDLSSLAGLTVDTAPGLSSLDLGTLPELEMISCSGTALRTLDLSGCPKISVIECEGNLFNSPYAVKVPESSDYYREFEAAPGAADEVLIKLDTSNDAVLSMSLYYAYAENPAAAAAQGTFGHEAVGDVAEFCETLGIGFPVKYAVMLNERHVGSVGGKFTPNATKNNLFFVKLGAVSLADAFKSLAGNEKIIRVEKNTRYTIDGPGEDDPNDEVFEDVKRDDWFFDNVNFVNKNGIMTGVGESKFSPDGTLTRAMAVTLLYRLGVTFFEYEYRGVPPVSYFPDSGFSDVERDSWYSEALNWAKRMGIVYGRTETIFDPNAPVTRAEFVTMLLRFHNLIGGLTWYLYDLHSDEKPADFDKIPDYAKDAVLQLYSGEIIKCRPGGIFDPLANLTRAEAAAIIDRYKNGLFYMVY